MGFGFKQPLVGEKRCVTTLITAAKETTVFLDIGKFSRKSFPGACTFTSHLDVCKFEQILRER